MLLLTNYKNSNPIFQQNKIKAFHFKKKVKADHVNFTNLV